VEKAVSFCIISVRSDISSSFLARENNEELEEDGFEKSVSCEELLLAAYDVISRVFSQKAVINAFYNTNPDTMTLRYDNDSVRQMCPTYFKK